MQVLSIFSAGKYYDVTGEGYEPDGDFFDAEENLIRPSNVTELEEMLTFSAICNDALLVKNEKGHGIQGTPTEGALAVVAQKAEINKQRFIDEGGEIIHAFPFDSSRKLMSVVVKHKDGQSFGYRQRCARYYFE